MIFSLFPHNPIFYNLKGNDLNNIRDVTLYLIKVVLNAPSNFIISSLRIVSIIITIIRVSPEFILSFFHIIIITNILNILYFLIPIIFDTFIIMFNGFSDILSSIFNFINYIIGVNKYTILYSFNCLL